jgi:hypothetical protein
MLYRWGLIQGATIALLSFVVGFLEPRQSSAAGPGEMCGGYAGIRCDRGLRCYIRESGIADAMGVCVPVESCPDITEPVCGRSGKTYQNNCKLRRAGDTKIADGWCE